MKKIIISSLLFALLTPAINARPKKPKSGTVKDRVFADSKYDFKLQLPEGWKYKTTKAKDNFRLILTKNNFEIPSRYVSAPDYTMTPRIVLWVSESSLSPFEFLDSLLSDSHKSDQKSELLKEFDILNDRISEGGNTREKIVPKQRKPIKMGKGIKAVSWTCKMNYRRQIATSASSAGGRRVRGSYGGAIFVIEREDILYMFHLITEIEYFEPNMLRAINLVKSLSWEEQETEEKK